MALQLLAYKLINSFTNYIINYYEDEIGSTNSVT